MTSPALFPECDDQALHKLIESSFRQSAVRAVTIDRSQSSVVIDYDRAAIDSRVLLQQLSQRLSAADQTETKSLVHEYLNRVPGRIKRVERRIVHDAGALEGSLLDDGQLVVENLIVEYERHVAGGDEAAASAQDTACQQLSVAGALPPDVTRPWIGEVVVGGVRRIVNLTAAGGCLVMSIIGVVTPGIPTVPFVLATGYFLARSSPRLHQRFRSSKIFGRMVTDYEDHGGLRWSTKLKSILFTVGLMVLTVVIVGATLPLLIVVGVMGSLGIYLLSRIPTLHDDSLPAAAVPAMA